MMDAKSVDLMTDVNVDLMNEVGSVDFTLYSRMTHNSGGRGRLK